MADIQIRDIRMRKKLMCECGRPISQGDIRPTTEGAEAVCSACHSTLFQIDLVLQEDMVWD